MKNGNQQPPPSHGGAMTDPAVPAAPSETGLATPRPEAESRLGSARTHTGVSSKLEGKPKVAPEEMRAANRAEVHARLMLIAMGTREDFSPEDLERVGLPDWTQVLNALNQLRDMYGFKAPAVLRHASN